MPAQGDKGNAILAVHFIVGDAATLMWKLGTRWSISMHKGEWAYHTHSKALRISA